MNFLEQFGESFEGADVEGGVEELMESLGLQDILDTLETMFADIGPQLEAMFGDLDIDSWFGGDDEENDEFASANTGEIPDQLNSQNILESSQEHASFLREALSDHTNLIGAVLDLPGNIADSPTAIAMVNNLDLSRPVEIVYHFHGLNSQDPSSTGRFDQTLDVLENSGRNAILVYPLNRNQSAYDRAWMNGESDGNDSNGDFDIMHASVLDYLDDSGIHLSNFSVIAQGHSAGGQPIRNIAESGSTTVDRFVFLDASYGGENETNWAQACYEAASDNYQSVEGRELDMQVFFIVEPPSNRRGGRTDNEGVRSIIGDPGVTHFVMNRGAGNEDIDHGGAIDEFFGGVDPTDPGIQSRIMTSPDQY